jgi:hypothetical protein
VNLSPVAGTFVQRTREHDAHHHDFIASSQVMTTELRRNEVTLISSEGSNTRSAPGEVS